MITTIAHVCLVVQRLDEAVAFYRDRLGSGWPLNFGNRTVPARASI